MDRGSQNQKDELYRQFPKDESRGTTPSQAASSSTSSSLQRSKRSRAPSNITPNACIECRKKRAKCDGQKPCGRCKSRQDVECAYEIPVRQSKEHLRDEIERQRQRQRSTDLVLTGLTWPNLQAEVLARLHAEQPVEGISCWLKNAMHQRDGALPSLTSTDDEQVPGEICRNVDMASSFASDVSETPVDSRSAHNADIDVTSALQPPSRDSLSAQHTQSKFSIDSETKSAGSISRTKTLNQTPIIPEPARSRLAVWAKDNEASHILDSSTQNRGLHQALSTLHDPQLKQGMTQNTGTWTSVTSDTDLVHHLLALYFCWEYPTFATLSKEHFLLDFKEGRRRYCSSMLVNALLALGCRFSKLPMTKADPGDAYSSGQHFFKESLRLLRQETDYHSLLMIQTLGILSIREASCGRVAESIAFSGQSMRLAVEMGLHCIVENGEQRRGTDEIAVQCATFWGAFSLDHAWSLATGSLPQCSKFPYLPPKPPIVFDIETSLWIPYTDSGVPLQQHSEQQSNVRSVYRCFAELSELNHQTLYLLYSPDGSLTARNLLNIYTNYIKWFDQMPEALRLGQNSTPGVLFCHMHYHFAVLLLFRPMINLRIVGSKVRPRDICSQAAHAIHTLLESYAQLYTLKYTPAFLPHYVLTSSVTYFAIGVLNAQSNLTDTRATLDPQSAEAVKRGMVCLAEMAPCHHFAEQALNILRYLVQQWNLNIDIGAGPVMDVKEYDRFIRPYASTLNFFKNNRLAEELILGRDTGRASSGTTSPQVEKAMEMMENLLIRPIPVQGPSILLREQEPDEEGFAEL